MSDGPTSANPITYRMLFEEAAGMGLSDDFFVVSQIPPDAAVKCNCRWDGGHEVECNLVAANALLEKMRRILSK